MAPPFRAAIARTLELPPSVGSVGGRFRAAIRSGLLTTIAAKTATLGHVAAFRNASTTKTVLVDRIDLKAAMVTDFTAAQRLALAAYVARAYTAAHTGGTAATLTGNNAKKKTSGPASADVSLRIGTTTALTAGTHTLDAQPFLVAESGQPSAAPTDANLPILASFDGREAGPLVLAQDEGIVLANEVLMGAAGTLGLAIEISWREILNAEVED